MPWTTLAPEGRLAAHACPGEPRAKTASPKVIITTGRFASQTVLGLDLTRRHQAVEGTRTRTRGFLTVYAGVEQ